MSAWRAAAAAGVVTTALLTALLAGCVTQTQGGNSVEHTPTAADKERGAGVHLELASLYLSRGQTQTALDEIKQVLAVKPDLAKAYDLQGLIYAAQGDTNRAQASFERALQLAPGDGGTRHNYGWFLCQQQRYDEADEQFAQALAEPRYGDAERTLLARGVCQARAGHWALAERTLSRSYELDPANPATAYNLSDVLLHLGQLDRARFYVGRINANREQSTAQSLWLAARIEHRAGNLQAARALGRQLADRFPKSPEALRYEAGKYDE